MIKKPFFGWGSPRLKYPAIGGGEKEPVTEIPLPQKASILIDYPFEKITEMFLKKGDRVKTGQRIRLSEGGNDYFISTVTGTVEDISIYTGYMGRTYSAIHIEGVTEDQWDPTLSNAGDRLSTEICLKFFRRLPGIIDLERLVDPVVPLDAIVIKGIDEDLLVKTNQLVLLNNPEGLTKGVRYLKELTKAKRMIITVPPGLSSDAGNMDADVIKVKPVYPQALPKMIMKNVFKRTVPAGMTCEDMGVAFINAEAVVALADAIDNGVMPVDKNFTLIDKDGKSMNIRARIGTSFKDVFERLNIKTEHGDSIILGGPMRGRSVYMEDMPVNYNTDAIIIQHKDDITENVDIPCINCGECVRACPAGIQVNMLVRLLENGLYDEAAREYDLMSCIECGLCTYVCTARIPVFHYIMLGKAELAKQKSREVSNG
ncbi:MAG: 4Fe-4S dicluster domain-containing protein [Deltaproteobacteria bacterium]|nr:4Fe-4S dicluster domain-containing protein [Deltaproteobacteria bacterium]